MFPAEPDFCSDPLLLMDCFYLLMTDHRRRWGRTEATMLIKH